MPLLNSRFFDEKTSSKAKENKEKIVKKYLEHEGIMSQDMLKKWMESKSLNEKNLLKLAIRHKKWLAFCSKRFKSMAATLFLKRILGVCKIIYGSRIT